MATREGRWRCPRCNTENLGRHLECQGCGDTRDDDVSFYLPEDEPAVSDRQLLDLAEAGPDLLCEHCDSSNRPGSERCRQCGAPLGQRSRQVEYQPDSPEPAPVAIAAIPADDEQPKKLGLKAKLGCFGCLASLLMVIFAVVAGLMVRRDVTLTVRTVAWERSIEVEELVTHTDSGWEDELPAGARIRSRERKIRRYQQVQVGTRMVTEPEEYQVQVGTEQVKVGTRDLGNGFFEDVFEDRPVYETRTRQVEVSRSVYEQQPVYGLEVSYELDRWQVARTAAENGFDTNPYWPELNLGANQRERSGSRRERYRVKLIDRDRKLYSIEVKAHRFQRYQIGSKHKAKVDLFGEIHNL